jgi:mannosyltransferase OCH1-like enzyme
MIPKIIHQMWIGDPMPNYMIDCQTSWRILHPEWTIIDWGDWVQATIAGDEWPFHHQELINRAHEISPEPYQFISDVVRYEVLHRKGGVWVDMDMECQKPIEALIGPTIDAFMAWEVPDRWLNNAIMAAEPETPFLAETIRALPQSVHRRRGQATTRISGPQFITPIALRHRVWTYPKEWFYPYLWNELDRMGEAFPDAYAVHHWNNRRKRLNGE